MGALPPIPDKEEKCKYCNGQGFTPMEALCPDCKGSGIEGVVMTWNLNKKI